VCVYLSSLPPHFNVFIISREKEEVRKLEKKKKRKF
jgi:hypothetical protein